MPRDAVSRRMTTIARNRTDHGIVSEQDRRAVRRQVDSKKPDAVPHNLWLFQTDNPRTQQRAEFDAVYLLS